MTGAEHRAHEDVDHAQVAFHPPILLLGFLGLGFVLRWLIPTPFLPNNVATIVGPLLVLAALVLFAWAVIVMRRGDASVPTGEPTKQLVFAGPFRVSRNPIYLSMVSLLVGTAIWSNCAWFLGLAGAMIVLLSWGVITREERYLERKFGEPYNDLQTQRQALVLAIRRLRSTLTNARARFSNRRHRHRDTPPWFSRSVGSVRRR